MEKNSQKKRRKYDADFKQEVLKMVANGRSVQDISNSLGIGANLIHKWKARSLPAPVSSHLLIIPTGEPVPYAAYEEIKARLKQAEQERDILKKALGIFSRED